MERDRVLSVLREAEPALRALGIEHVALFGSVARGEAREGSDVDLMVDIDAAAPIGVFEYVGVVQALQALFAEPVDVSNHAAQRPAVRAAADRDAVYAF